MVRHHHERWDGGGYPDRLRAEQIPLAARILCLADVFDALTTARSYRPAYSRDGALAIMRESIGTMFDPSLFPLFLEVVEGERAITLPAFPSPLALPETRQIARLA